MDSFTKAMRPSKLDACIENITRTLTQRSSDDQSQNQTSSKNMYRTEPFQSTGDGSTSLKMKIRKVSSYHTPEELKPYECPICHKRISNQANLRTHIRTHTGDKPHRCGICGKSFSRNGTLQTHLTIHSGIKLYKCEICGREIRDRGNLSKHMKIHLTSMVSCKREPGSLGTFPRRENGLDYTQRNLKREADQQSSQMEMFQKELYALNSSQMKNLEREIGQHLARSQMQALEPKQNSSKEASTANRSSLPAEKHGDTKTNETLKINMFAKLEMKKRDPPFSKKVENDQENKAVSYNCGLCAISFNNTDSYFAHMMAHARDQTYNQRGPDNYIDDRIIPWQHNRKPVKPEQTSPMLTQDEQNKKTVKPEQGTPMLTPEEQEMIIAYERELRAYGQQKQRLEAAMSDQAEMEEELEDEEAEQPKNEFKCGICSKVYPTKDSFEDHISLHKVDKPYQCTICLEQFKELHCLRKHIQSHRGLNSFWCEVCGEEFSQSIFLVEHLQRHAEAVQQDWRRALESSQATDLRQGAEASLLDEWRRSVSESEQLNQWRRSAEFSRSLEQRSGDGEHNEWRRSGESAEHRPGEAQHNEWRRSGESSSSVVEENHSEEADLGEWRKSREASQPEQQMHDDEEQVNSWKGPGVATGEPRQVATGEPRQVATGESRQVATGEPRLVVSGESHQVATGESIQVEATGESRQVDDNTQSNRDYMGKFPQASQSSRSNVNGNFNGSPSKIPQQQPPQGSNPDMFMVVE